jgi:MFS family permease
MAASTRPAVLIWTIATGQLLAWGAFYYALPVFVAPLADGLGWDRQLLFWGLSAALLTSVAAAPFVGRLVDRGHGRAALIGSQLLGASCLLLLSTADRLWLFLLLCCGLGIAQAACLYDIAFALLHRWLGKQAPAAIVRVTLIAGFAGTLFVPLAQWLVGQVGWRGAFLVVAALGGLPVASYAFLLPREPLPVRAGPEQPQLATFRPDRAAVAMVIAFGASTAAFSTVTIHFVPLMIDRGMTGLWAAQVFALIGPSQVAARLAMWPLAGRVVSYGVAIFLLQAAAVLALAAAGTGSLLFVFALLFGASSGLLTILRGISVAEVCRRDAIGRLNGIIGAVSGLCRALGPALFAVAVVRVGAETALAVLLTLSVLGAASFGLARAWRIAPAPGSESADGQA